MCTFDMHIHVLKCTYLQWVLHIKGTIHDILSETPFTQHNHSPFTPACHPAHKHPQNQYHPKKFEHSHYISVNYVYSLSIFPPFAPTLMLIKTHITGMWTQGKSEWSGIIHEPPSLVGRPIYCPFHWLLIYGSVWSWISSQQLYITII